MDKREIKEYDYTINILIAADKHNAGMLNEYFTSKSRFTVVGMTDDCERAKQLLLSKKPDVLIFDFLTHNGDGLSLLKYVYECQKVEPKPKCVLVTAFYREFFVNKALEMGAKFAMRWPCDFDELRNEIVDLFLKQFDFLKVGDSEEKIFDDSIMDLFKALGMSLNWQGYKYFRDAVRIKKYGKDKTMKDIYAELGDKYGVSVGAIERAMRRAIDTVWCKCGFVNLNDKFDREIFVLSKKPTTIEFIATILELMRV